MLISLCTVHLQFASEANLVLLREPLGYAKRHASGDHHSPTTLKPEVFQPDLQLRLHPDMLACGGGPEAEFMF